jgi:hypothetical protein
VLGGVGRAGFDPDMLVTLLVYGYANSRRRLKTGQMRRSKSGHL